MNTTIVIAVAVVAGLAFLVLIVALFARNAPQSKFASGTRLHPQPRNAESDAGAMMTGLAAGTMVGAMSADAASNERKRRSEGSDSGSAAVNSDVGGWEFEMGDDAAPAAAPQAKHPHQSKPQQQQENTAEPQSDTPPTDTPAPDTTSGGFWSNFFGMGGGDHSGGGGLSESSGGGDCGGGGDGGGGGGGGGD